MHQPPADRGLSRARTIAALRSAAGRRTLLLPAAMLIAPAACSYGLESYPGVSRAREAAVLGYPEYAALQHANPYVMRLDARDGAVLYFGARHTTRPEDPQIDSIRVAWNAFRPTVALAEARKAWRGSLDGGVRNFGESAAAVALAREAGLPVYTLEAPLEVEIGAMLERWSRERLLLFYVLRSYTARRPEGRSDGQARELIRERGRWPGLAGAFASVAGMDSAWARAAPQAGDWRMLPWESTWPDREDSWLNVLSADLNRFRDQYMIALIAALVGRGERVFAVVGASHVVMQEAALRAALGAAGGPAR